MEYARDDELLSAYLDRELSPDERAAVERLLAESAEARDRLNELEVTSRFLHRLPPRQLEADFADSVIDRLRSESLLRAEPVAPRRPNRRWAWWVGAPLAAAATLLIAVWIGRPSQRTEQPLYAPDSPSRALAEAATASPESKVANLLDQVDVGDIFGIVDQNGDRKFDLIVLAKPTEPDTIRCVLLDAEPANTPGEHEAVGMKLPEEATTLALEATQGLLAKLTDVLHRANAQPDTAFPVIDIVAYLDLDRPTMGRFTQHARVADATRDEPPAASDPLVKASGLASSGRAASPPPGLPRSAAESPADSERRAGAAVRSMEKSEEKPKGLASSSWRLVPSGTGLPLVLPSDSEPKAETMAGKGVLADKQSPASIPLPARIPTQSLAKGQSSRLRIVQVDVTRRPADPTATPELAKTGTRESVEALAKASPERFGSRSDDKDKKAPRRVDALLRVQFRDDPSRK